jgi:hypothetical protein
LPLAVALASRKKTKPSRLIPEISFADDFQRHRTTQINVERPVGDAQGAATELDCSALCIQHQVVILKLVDGQRRSSLVGALF